MSYDNYDAATAGILLITSIIGIVIALAWYVITAIGLQRVFTKYNHPQPWAAWIPFYNSWVLLELGRQPGWYALAPIAAIIPFIGGLGSILFFIVFIFAAININKAFGKSVGGWTVFAALLSGIWAIVLGFGKDMPNPALEDGPYFPPVKNSTQA